MSDIKRPAVGVGVFVWKDGQFIMGKRRGAHGEDTWSVPGGHMEFGETLEETAAREVLEETGLKIKNPRFLTATNDVFEKDNYHSITLWVYSDWAGGEPTITEPDKFIELAWKDFSTLPSPLFEPCWKHLRLMKPDLFK